MFLSSTALEVKLKERNKRRKLSVCHHAVDIGLKVMWNLVGTSSRRCCDEIRAL